MRNRILTAVVLGIAFHASVVHAQENDWMNPGNGDWEVPANWSLGVLPGNTQDVVVANAGSLTAFVTSAAPANSLQVLGLFVDAPSGSVNTVDFDIGSMIFTVGDDGPQLGLTGAGQIVLHSGTFLSPTEEIEIGENPGASGSVIIDGGTMSVYDTKLGEDGVGQLILSNGTYITGGIDIGSQADGQGTLTIEGGTMVVTGNTNGSGFSIPEGGLGSMWMNGGTIVSTNDNGIGIGLGSHTGLATMTVSNGSILATGISVGSGNFHPGNVRSGALSILNGDVRFLEWFIVGGNSNTGQAAISGGNVSCSNLLAVGVQYGTGTVTVAGGTLTASGSFVIGGGITFRGTNYDGGNGAVWVTGGQVVLTNATTMIASNGLGQMTVSNGLVLARDVNLGVYSNSLGTLTLAGGTMTATNVLLGTYDCSGTGVVVVAGGSLFVTNNTHSAVLEVRSGTLLVTGGTLVVDKLVTTNGCANFLQTGGTVVTGGSTNTLSGFRITAIEREGNNIRITWLSGGGHTNVVQVAQGVGGSYTNNFSNLSPQIILPGSGNVTTNYLDVGGATNKPARYYRVELLQ